MMFDNIAQKVTQYLFVKLFDNNFQNRPIWSRWLHITRILTGDVVALDGV